MRSIKLPHGFETIISDEDFDELSKVKWCAPLGRGGLRYAKISSAKSYMGYTSMHRYIMKARTGDMVDHINGDTLDNRRSNLRLVTASQNQANARFFKENTKTKVKGINLRPTGRFRARIQVNKKRIALGDFTSLEAAVNAYREASSEHFGEYARHDLSTRCS